MLENFDVYKASQRFIEIRTNAGKTQEQLAEELGVNSQTIKNYEKAGSPNAQSTSSNSRVNAIAGMKIETLYKMAKLFNVSADYLLGLTNDPFPAPRAVDELGLSTEAIQQLIDLQANSNENNFLLIPTDALEIADWLISNIDRNFLLFSLSKLREDAMEHQNIANRLKNSTVKQIRASHLSGLYSETQDKLDLAKYRVSKTLDKLLDYYIDDYCLHLIDHSKQVTWEIIDDGND